MSVLHQDADNVLGTPHARSTVTTAELLVIPAGWAGKYVRFASCAGSGAAVDIAIRFGDATAVAVIADRSTIDGSGNLTADVNAPHALVIAGTTERFRLDPSWTHFAHISGATTGCLRFALATGTG
jgi:hypothetical protein